MFEVISYSGLCNFIYFVTFLFRIWDMNCRKIVRNSKLNLAWLSTQWFRQCSCSSVEYELTQLSQHGPGTGQCVSFQVYMYIQHFGLGHEDSVISIDIVTSDHNTYTIISLHHTSPGRWTNSPALAYLPVVSTVHTCYCASSISSYEYASVGNNGSSW